MFEFFGDVGGAIMAPLYFITSVILSGFHNLFGGIFGDDSGAAWALSIIGLTLVIRAALIPLFVKQIKSSRNMQLLQPKLKELRDKYGHDRERFAQEQMKLFKDTGTNPLASCLPLILQMPIFLSLFRLIDRAAHGETRGVLSQDQVDSLAQAKIFGARIADTFTGAEGESATAVRVLAGLLVIAMTATTFLTQRQLMTKNMPPDALKGQYAQQQKMLLYILPLVFAIGGIAFPIGVIIYWTTSNLWTMGQQFYVIRRNPAPGTPAAKAKEERDAHKRARKGLPEPESTGTTTTAVAAPSEAERRRQQPKKQSREQRKKGKGAPPRGSGRPAGGKPR
ncbi:membrane protein insertase YidC [Nocardioides caldifontis]|uniref:membrane protein insertase YidC n=1 Tax=Nocardioides caldifontis TaxID=2588938 RepID=UPI0011E01650|nr:membrane protein insertase YidC [Nocardioides caldifontis]